jgi:hypothetical protein
VSTLVSVPHKAPRALRSAALGLLLGVAPLGAQTLRLEVPALRGAGFVHGAVPFRPGEIPAGRQPRAAPPLEGCAWIVARHPDGSARWIGISGFLRGERLQLTCAASRASSPPELAHDDDDARLGEYAARLGPNGSIRAGRLVVRGGREAPVFGAWQSASVGEGAGGPWVRRLEARSADGALVARAALVRSPDRNAARFEGLVHVSDGAPRSLPSLRVELAWEELGAPRALPFRSARQLGPALARVDGAELADSIAERLELDFDTGALVLCAPRIARRWPCAWYLDERGAALELLDGGAELARGEAVSFALELAWGRSTRELRGALFSSPRRAPLRAERRAYEASPSATALARFAAWSAAAPAGRRDHGDAPLEVPRQGEPVPWSNGEFDLALGLLRAWWCGAPPVSFELAEDSVRHALAVDLPVAGSEAERAGLPWRHGIDHGVGGVQDLGHTWVEGWLGVARVRGDPLALDAAFACAEAVARARFDPRRELELERSYAWPVIALAAAAAEFPGGSFEAALAARGRGLLEAYEPASGRFAFAGRRRAGAPGGEVHVWLSGGLLAEALGALAEAAPEVRAGLGPRAPREAAAGLLATLWGEAYSAGERRFAARVRSTSRGVQRLGQLRGVPEAYALRGLEHLARLARDPALERRARELLAERGAALAELRPERWWNDFALAGRCLPCPLRPSRH